MTRFKSSKPKLKPEHDRSESKHPPAYSHRLQQGLGFLSLAIVGGGTALVLAILGFLLFLWTGEGSQDGRKATALWRWIMLNQQITQAITLSTVLLRIAVTAQASIYTSLLAGVVLEKHGVPLFRVAEMSVIRCTNDGPFQLTWLLLTSARKAYMQTGLAILLLLTTFVVQFPSTLLVSDLGTDDLVGDAKARKLESPDSICTIWRVALRGKYDDRQSVQLQRYGHRKKNVPPPLNITNVHITPFQYTEMQARQGFTNTLCIPNGTAARPNVRNYTISENLITPYSQVFLFLRNQGTHDLWKGPGNRVLAVIFGLNNVTSTDGDWLTYNRPIGGRLPTGEKIETGVLRLDMSLYFQQLAFNFAEVKLSSKKDLKESQVTWTSEAKAWNTKNVQRLMGIGAHGKSSCGIFSVDSVQNPRHLSATQFLTNKLINDSYNSPRTFKFSLFMDPQDSGNSPIKPHVEYQAIFADILNVTNRPGVAMESTLTALSGSIINEALPQFDVQSSAILTSSVRVLTPKSLRKLLIIFGVMTLNMACGLAVVLVFMVQSRYLSQGNYWQGVAQIVSDETAWILEGATDASDGHVEDEIGVDGYIEYTRNTAL
ncbi:hypothetical protein CSAL01_03829 [Colletotrichum salicis]|uniref:Uncharacterized protein n=1 Tax=Colletotrichum salicis TaxID=1209931 RepID=A0A135S5W7_9PEZI|nr:hypothetical protein CSAL01_03829 [Colletotrichum salicis]